VYRQGRRFAASSFVMYVRPDESPLRVAVTAGRRIGGAVQRNRAKRRLREAFRRLAGRLSGRGDVILTARPRALDAAFSEIVSEMERLCVAGRLMRGHET